ncbi:sugar ABC transporter permease [Verrucomicrobiota bacterium]
MSTVNKRNAILLASLVVIAGVFQFLTRDAQNPFLSARSISTVFTQASVIGVLACGMTFIIILTHIDLSVGSALAFLGGIAAWMMAPPAHTDGPGAPNAALGLMDAVPSGPGFHPAVVLVLIPLVGILLWAAKGLLQSYTGMPAFIITLGGMMGYRGLSYLIVKREIPIAYDGLISRIGTDFLDVRLGWAVLAAVGVYAAVSSFTALHRGGRVRPASLAAPALLAGVVVFLQMKHPGVNEDARGISYLTCIWAATALAMSYVADNTVYGRHLYATGGNFEAARLCGIRVRRVNIAAFACMGLVVSIASLMYLGQQGTAESSAGQLAELDAIAACVIGGVSLRGGKGSIAGAALGAIIMQSLTSGLYQCNVESGYQMVVKAVVLVGVIAIDHAVRRD